MYFTLASSTVIIIFELISTTYEAIYRIILELTLRRLGKLLRTRSEPI